MLNFSSLKSVELIAGLEPATSSLPRKCSTSEPYERQTLGIREFLKKHKQLNEIKKVCRRKCIKFNIFIILQLPV